MSRIFCQTVFIIFLGGCAQLQSVSSSIDTSQIETNSEAVEAIFRYQFMHDASGVQSGAQVYCIGFSDHQSDRPNNGDPSQQFLLRFTDVKPPVKALSQCSASADKGVSDKATGKIGLIFRVTSIKCATDSKCEASGGYYEGGLSSSGDTYFLEKRLEKWVV